MGVELYNMEIFSNLFKSLVPDLNKDRIVEDMRNTRIMLEDLMEIYQLALPVFRTYTFQSKDVKDRVEKFKRLTGSKENPVVFFNKNIPLIIKNLDLIKTVFLNESNRMIIAQALTFKQSNMLAYVDALFLVNKGARKFLVWMEAHESAHYNRTESELLEEISPAEEKWLAESFTDFCQAAKIVVMTPDKTMEKLESVIDAQANEKSMKALMAAGKSSIADPFTFGLIGTRYNPIIFFRMIVAEYQVARYKEAEEELRGLRLQLARLENTAKGKNDPKLEQQIKYMRGRITGLARDIAEMEKSYA